MSETALEPLNKTIALPGCSLSPTALVFSGEPTDAELASIGLSLQRMEGCKAWWWGDFLVKLEQRRGEHYTDKFAEMAGLERQSLRRYKMVAEFFKPLHRCNDLSWTHHLEAALADSRSIDEGAGWLEKAREEKLTVPRLRAAIRLSKRDRKLDDDSARPEETYTELLAFNRWCRRMLPRVEGFDRERAHAILGDLNAAIPFIEALQQRAGLTPRPGVETNELQRAS